MTLTEAQVRGCCINHPGRPGTPYASDVTFHVLYCVGCKRGHGRERQDDD